MSTLICDLRPGAATLADEYRGLRQAGEPVVLYWPHAAPAADMVVVPDLAALHAALDDERLACLEGEALPAWLSLDDCHRVLLLSESPGQLPAAETELVATLLAAGAEAVELLSAADAVDLAQSWHSGRRVGARRISN